LAVRGRTLGFSRIEPADFDAAALFASFAFFNCISVSLFWLSVDW
jgi:hypothetical protein